MSGNITNNGTIDLYSDVNDVCNLTFNSAINGTISGTGNFDLNNVILYKATSAYCIDVQSNAFENGTRNLILSYGTFIHDNTGLYNVNAASSSAFQIDPSVIIKVPQGGLALSPNADEVYLQGSLYVNGGTVYIGSTAGNKGLRTQQGGSTVPYLEVASGTLIVYGGITHNSGAGSDPFSFKMTGGNILLNCGSGGTNVEPFFITDASGSSFNMSGGIITIQASTHGGSSTVDFSICGNNGTVNTTGGTVEFGNAETLSGDAFTFEPFPNVVQPNFKITGDPAALVELSASQTGTSDFKVLSLFIDVLKTFDTRSLSGTSGDSKTMTVTSTYDGVTALYNDGSFISRTGTVILGGTSVQQISGNNKFTFYNLTMNNTAGALLAKSVDVSNQLTMSSGILTTTASNVLTGLSACNSNLGSSASYIDGPMINTIATTVITTKNFPVGKSGAYRPIILSVQHATSVPVIYQANMLNSSARAFNYALPASLAWVSGVRYFVINRQNISNLINASITLAYGADDEVYDYTNLRVARDNGSSAWIDLGGVGTANNTGTITSSLFTGFNTLFTLANPPGGTNPLPVELLNFNAYRDNEKVLLEWSTASEKSSDYFEIERSSDLIHYFPVDHLKAAGNSNTVLHYHTYDSHPSEGTNYYRLKQVDYDGAISFSELRAIEFIDLSNDLFKIYPNPSSAIFYINTPQDYFNHESLCIYDLNGKIMDFSLVSFSNGTGGIKLNGNVSNGVYKVALHSPLQRWQGTVLVNKKN